MNKWNAILAIHNKVLRNVFYKIFQQFLSKSLSLKKKIRNTKFYVWGLEVSLWEIGATINGQNDLTWGEEKGQSLGGGSRGEEKNPKTAKLSSIYGNWIRYLLRDSPLLCPRLVTYLLKQTHTCTRTRTRLKLQECLPLKLCLRS